jgi:hypothetical protein
LLRCQRNTLYRQKVGTNFADKKQSLGRYSPLIYIVSWDVKECNMMGILAAFRRNLLP